MDLDAPDMKNCSKRKRSDRTRSGSAARISEEEEEGARCLILLSNIGSGSISVGNSLSDKHLFSCSVCGRSFPSYQALGGHKTVHRTKNKTSQKKPALTDDVAPVQPKVHECNICFRIFSSGQALGGHKRLHYEKGGEDLKLKFEFDLNLPPLMEEEEEEEEEEEDDGVRNKPRI